MQDTVADACKMFYLTHICNFSLNITFTSFTTLKHRWIKGFRVKSYLSH